MIRAEIHLPDELYERARQFGDEREISLEEVTRQGLELLLARPLDSATPARPWVLPRFDGGGIRVPLDQLREISDAEAEARSVPGRCPS